LACFFERKKQANQSALQAIKKVAKKVSLCALCASAVKEKPF
jgi:hypothetical protein